MSKKRKMCVFIAVFIFIIYIARVVYVNANYDKPHEYIYDKGTECIYNDFKYYVKQHNIYDGDDEEFLDYNFNINRGKNNSPTKYLVIELNCTYVGEQDKEKLSTMTWRVQTNTWHNGIYDVKYSDNINEFTPNQTKNIYLCVGIVNSGYTIRNSHWNNLDNLDYQLILRSYPEIVILKCGD